MKYLAMAFFTVTLFASSANAGYADANKFWTRFQQAVINNDLKTIMTLTRFPFKVRGTDDRDNVVQYNRAKFPGLYKRLINQKEDSLAQDGKVQSKTLLELIKNKKKLGPTDLLARDFLRVYDLEFTRINGSWFFTLGYFDE